MTDAFFKKQLEQFGTESVRMPSSDKDKKPQLQISHAVVQSLMDSMQGRQWLYDMLDMCNVFTAPFVSGKPDVTAFLSGMQAIGHIIYGEIMKAAPQHYYLMIQESAARKAAKTD